MECQRFALAFSLLGVTYLFGGMESYRFSVGKNADPPGVFQTTAGSQALPRPIPVAQLDALESGGRMSYCAVPSAKDRVKSLIHSFIHS